MTDINSPSKRNWEQMAFNTYGIEIEFGTHDNQMLSFTHIEVAHLLPNQGMTLKEKKKNAWKIETDADYTLELVSPILTFSSAEYARKFRNDVICFLEFKVRKGIKLGTLLNQLVHWLKNRGDLNDQEKPSGILYISNTQLIESLDWFNWDEDTDLERVLACKKLLPNDDNACALLKDTTVTKSRKHGGLPSSQMNVPLTFYNYISYLRDKLSQAEKRLLRYQNYTMPAYGERFFDKLKNQRYCDDNYITVPDGTSIFSDNVWVKKFTNPDYLDEQLDSKTPIWHRYWLWLSTFVTCRRALAFNPQELAIAVEKSDELHKTITTRTHAELKRLGANPENVLSAERCLEDLIGLSRETLQFNLDNDIALHDLIQFILMKLITGAMSELSEVHQAALQKIVVTAKGQISMDDLVKIEPNAEFMQFHYALKDLTPLWFKATLLDTINSEGEGKQRIFLRLLRQWQGHEEEVTLVVENILKTQFTMLGFYHAYTSNLNQGFDYDWDAFKSYNLPSIGTLMRQFNKSLKELTALIDNFGEWDAVYRSYQGKYIKTSEIENFNLRFLEREKAEKTVAPWEGRFDTMKNPIRNTNEKGSYLYLVEHRNN